MGDDATWEKAEDALRGALRAAGVEWEELPGEGAFYGPKIEYHLRDAIGRTWQLGTMQVDFMMPARLGAEYVDEQSQKRNPVILHRAIVGSMERFIGILIETGRTSCQESVCQYVEVSVVAVSLKKKK